MTTSTYNNGGQLIGTDASGTLTTYTYDASGNLQAEVTSAGTRSYTWDYDDRLTDIEYPDSSETNYIYNSAGQRLTKVEGGTTTRFVYDGAKVVLERNGDDETEVRYTHEGGSLYSDLLSQRRDGASYDYLLDGLASVKQVVDSSQAVENSYAYEAFGQPTVGQSDVANPYLFVGGYGVRWESTPSLYFMQARYYSPSIGRFISEDPYGGAPQDPLSLHRYLYCANGPVSRRDATGMITWYDVREWAKKNPWWAYAGAGGAVVFPCTVYATHLWKLACKAEPGMRLHLNRDLCLKKMISGELPESPYPRYFTDEEGNRVVCRNTGRKVQTWDPKRLVWVDVNTHGFSY